MAIRAAGLLADWRIDTENRCPVCGGLVQSATDFAANGDRVTVSFCGCGWQNVKRQTPVVLAPVGVQVAQTNEPRIWYVRYPVWQAGFAVAHDPLPAEISPASRRFLEWRARYCSGELFRKGRDG